MTPFESRLAGLVELGAAMDLDLVILGQPAWIRWATGHVVAPGEPALLLLDRDSMVLLAAEPLAAEPLAAEPPAASAPLPGLEIATYAAYSPGRLVDAMAELARMLEMRLRRMAPLRAVGIEAGHFPVLFADRLGDVRRVDLGPALAHLRLHKDAEEIAGIRRSIAAVDRALEVARTAVRPGLRETDLLAVVVEALRAEAGDDVVVQYNLGTGPRSAERDPHATDRRVAPGDVVLLDLYPVIEGYVADLTRTYVVGEPDPVQVARHDALVTALDAGAAALRPGVPGRAVAAVIRETLVDAVGSLADSMWHHAGHGIGIFAWEEPWIGVETDLEVPEGTVIALEPGCYEAAWGGMRVEGNYLVTSTGAERLDHAPFVLEAGS